jgi:hypothetical protein
VITKHFNVHQLHPVAAGLRFLKPAVRPSLTAPRFMANVDAALEQQVLDVSQRQREADVHHHDQPDHLR